MSRAIRSRICSGLAPEFSSAPRARFVLSADSRTGAASNSSGRCAFHAPARLRDVDQTTGIDRGPHRPTSRFPSMSPSRFYFPTVLKRAGNFAPVAVRRAFASTDSLNFGRPRGPAFLLARFGVRGIWPGARARRSLSASVPVNPAGNSDHGAAGLVSGRTQK